MMRQHRQAITRFSLGLGWILQITVFSSLAVAQSNIVFMTSDVDLPAGLQSRLHRFDAGVESFATDTGAATAFQGVTILNGHVLVADYLAEQIQRFALDGTYLGAFAPFINPTFLESDSSGNVYATSSSLGGSAASRLNSSGGVTQTFTLGEAFGIDADAAGNVYIAQGGPPGSRNLFKFASDGTFLNSIPLGAINPADLSIDESSNLLYLADQASSLTGVKVFDISGAMPSLVGSVATPADSVIVGTHFAAESGNILAVDFGVISSDPRGLEYSPSGALLREYRPADAIVAFDITTFIPEPSTSVLVMMGMIGAILRRPPARR